ncbi:Sin3 associated polypeptide p18-domain-containing protein [Mycotypha africana]|uniref:Sin3 associated polypeptide p18-domain-containing protein n=1 Tax=Mycotypha africana TaxID=64632 RepID=UPI002301A790|nr:Sin3 associated polypeptide p18-domain-containing protein [Mycotypha africana]KAI8981784.1 Sin3 associated polypeptide p18-domain-containing protein [Mycotypha africana]
MPTTVDREKECPFLLKIYYCHGRHNPKDATLEEIAQLIEQIVPEARDPDARVAFRLIYLDSERARYQSREIGRVVASNPTEDQKKTLDDCKFLIGDYLDVAIYIGPPPSAYARGAGGSRSFGGGRDNNRGRPLIGGGNKFGGNDRYGGGRRSFDKNNAAPYNRDRFGGAGGGRYQRRDRY